MDVDGVKKAAEEWKQKAEQAERDAAQRIADMEFNGTLKEAIAAVKVRTPRLSPPCWMDALKQSKNQADGHQRSSGSSPEGQRLSVR